MAVAVIGNTPAGLGAMVAVVDDAHTSVDGCADGCSAGSPTAVQIGDVFIGVVLKRVADEVDVLVVVFAVVSGAGAYGTDAKALVDPSKAFRHIALIVKHLVDLVGQMGIVLHRETANHHFLIMVSAFDLAEPVVGIFGAVSRGEGVRGDVFEVTNKQYKLKVAGRVVIDVGDVVLDSVLHVAANFAYADHCGGTS